MSYSAVVAVVLTYIADFYKPSKVDIFSVVFISEYSCLFAYIVKYFFIQILYKIFVLFKAKASFFFKFIYQSNTFVNLNTPVIFGIFKVRLIK